MNAADSLMAIFGYQRVKSCWDCQHNQPEGCTLRMPSYETYEPCSKFTPGEYEPGTDKEEGVSHEKD